jgi:hypothetical protein
MINEVRRGIIAQGRYWEKKPATLKKRVLSFFLANSTKQGQSGKETGHQIVDFSLIDMEFSLEALALIHPIGRINKGLATGRKPWDALRLRW